MMITEQITKEALDFLHRAAEQVVKSKKELIKAESLFFSIKDALDRWTELGESPDIEKLKSLFYQE